MAVTRKRGRRSESNKEAPKSRVKVIRQKRVPKEVFQKLEAILAEMASINPTSYPVKAVVLNRWVEEVNLIIMLLKEAGKVVTTGGSGDGSNS